MAKINYGFSCGRGYLSIDGFVIAMEGDPCRDFDLTAKGAELYDAEWAESNKKYPGSFVYKNQWTFELIKWFVENHK